MTISWEDFERVDMRVGVVVDAQEFPEARRPALKLSIDFGPLGLKRSSAQITHHYSAGSLVGRRVKAVRRHGKHLWLELDRRPWPCLHFGMTGGIHVPAGRAVRRRLEKEHTRWISLP